MAMTPTRLLIWQFLLAILVIALFTWAATQWTASALGYQEGLGAPWFVLGDWPIYRPWRFFQWWYAYDAYAPIIFWKGAGIFASGGIAAFVSAVIGSLLRARETRNATTHGSARWALPKDARKARLFKKNGVVLGAFDGKYLRHNGPEHVLAFAPTRSGKGVGLVVPSLLSWGASAIIHDIKGENWDLTSADRARFSRCLRFDPTSMGSARFNPLMEVRKGANEVRDAQNIAEMIIDPDGSLNRKEHWDRTAYKLIYIMILHVLYAEEEKTLAHVGRLLTQPGKSVEDILEMMMSTNHVGTDAEPRVHPEIARGAKEVGIKPDRERGSVVSTMLGYFAVYSDPIVQRATAASDFTIDDIIHGDRPISLYLTVPPSDLIRTRPLMRLILTQIMNRLLQEHPSPNRLRHRVLLMLDEFPALGRIDSFELMLAFMASYGLKAFLVAQSLNQVEKAYGASNAFLDNCHVRVTFATNDERTAKRVSDMLGTKTEQRHQRNYTGHRLSVWLSHVMVSQQETQRPLLTPGEIMQLPPNQSIVQVSGTPPILAEKLRYYEDQNFAGRVGKLEPDGTRPPIITSCWDGRVRKAHVILRQAAIEEKDRQRRQLELEFQQQGLTPHGGGNIPPSDRKGASASDILRAARFMAGTENEKD